MITTEIAAYNAPLDQLDELYNQFATNEAFEPGTFVSFYNWKTEDCEDTVWIVLQTFARQVDVHGNFFDIRIGRTDSQGYLHSRLAESFTMSSRERINL